MELAPKAPGDPEAPRVDDDFHKHPMQRPGFAMSPVDGLPVPATNVDLSLTAAPPLMPETFVCMGDNSKFELRRGLRLLEFDPSEVLELPDGFVVASSGLTPERWREVLAFRPPEVVTAAERLREDTSTRLRWLSVLGLAAVTYCAVREGLAATVVAFLAFAVAALLGRRRQAAHCRNDEALSQYVDAVAVEPRRRPCVHYRRQLSDHQGDHTHRSLNRYCLAMRDENGEFVSMRDARLYACELREPRDFTSQRLIDAFDQKTIAQARQEHEEFDVDAALERALGAAERGDGQVLESGLAEETVGGILAHNPSRFT